MEKKKPSLKNSRMQQFPTYSKANGTLKSVRIIRASFLMSSAGKILARILLNRLNEHLEQSGLLPESQCGFRKDRRTIDMTFTARQLQEKCAGLGGSVGCASNWRPGGRGFNPRRGWQHSFVEIDHEIFSTVILSLPLIQEGQLSVSGKRMHNTG